MKGERMQSAVSQSTTECYASPTVESKLLSADNF
jgi:hypothetical protein